MKWPEFQSTSVFRDSCRKVRSQRLGKQLSFWNLYEVETIQRYFYFGFSSILTRRPWVFTVSESFFCIFAEICEVHRVCFFVSSCLFLYLVCAISRDARSHVLSSTFGAVYKLDIFGGAAFSKCLRGGKASGGCRKSKWCARVSFLIIFLFFLNLWNIRKFKMTRSWK